MESVLVMVAAFLIGSLPAAWAAGRLRGTDLRTQGSGNLGATNTYRILGRAAGAAVLALDAAKGLAAVLVLPLGAGPGAFGGLPVLAGLACVLGHVFPPWFRFRGGKGVATGAAVALALAPWAAPACLAAFVIVAFATRYVSLASVTAAAVLPVSYGLIYREGAFSPWVMGFCVAAFLLVVFAHRSNLKRLVRGEERRWSSPGRRGSGGA